MLLSPNASFWLSCLRYFPKNVMLSSLDWIREHFVRYINLLLSLVRPTSVWMRLHTSCSPRRFNFVGPGCYRTTEDAIAIKKRILVTSHSNYRRHSRDLLADSVHCDHAINGTTPDNTK